MSVTSIIFSKDRPAQLDLLLRSMKQNAPAFYDTAWVLASVREPYYFGYRTLRDEHPSIKLAVENPDQTFAQALRVILAACAPKVAFFVDDDVFYRPLPVANPSAWLDLFPETLAFSLRLGLNTTECYPLRCPQTVELMASLGAFIQWEWTSPRSTCDYSYPASLDGNLFRRTDLLKILKGVEFTNPNQLEEALVAGIASGRVPRGRMAAFRRSCLVGIPANSVSETHGSNRHGEFFAVDPVPLNDGYLTGRRLSLDVIEGLAPQVNAAHVEMPLLWEGEGS